MADQAFDDVDRLLRALRDDPERRGLLRAIVVDETLQELSAAMRGLAEAQARTERRLESLAERVDALAEAQARTERRLESLAERVDALAEAQTRTERRLESLAERVDALAEAQTRTEQRLAALTRTVDQLTATVTSLVEQVSALTGHVDWLRGDAIERRYGERPHTHLSRVARRMHLLSPRELDDLLDPAVGSGVLTDEEADKIRAADGVFHGRRVADGADAYIVVEASVGVGLSDVERARERADLLARTGVPVEAVVGGTWIVPEAAGLAQASRVWQITDGRALPPAS